MVARDIWDVEAQFESGIFYLIGKRKSEIQLTQSSSCERQLQAVHPNW